MAGTKDARGKVVREGKRIKRLHPGGRPIKAGTSMVLAVREDEHGRTVVDYEELKSLKRGTVLLEQVHVLDSPPSRMTMGERQYKVDKDAAAAVSKKVSKRRKGLLR